MRLVFTESAWQDHLWFQEMGRQSPRQINQLIKDMPCTTLDVNLRAIELLQFIQKSRRHA